MPRSTSSTVLTPFRSTNPSHVSLIEIATGDTGTPFIRRTDRDYDVTFNSFVFSAYPNTWSNVTVASHTEQGGVDIKVPDLDGAIATLALSGYCFRSTRVRLWLTDIAATGGSGSDGYLEHHYVESVECEDGAVTFHCRPQLAVFDVDLPRGTMTRDVFPGLPSDGLQ